MKKIIFPIIMLTMIFLFVFHSTSNATNWTFELISSDISGTSGSTIGWGYTISNLDNSNWLMLDGLSAGSFLNGTPLSIFDFPILSPLQTLTIDYDGFGSGLYELTWDSAAPIGFVNSGEFTLFASWYDGDPFTAGQYIDIATEKSASYTASVSGSSTVPESSSLLLIITGLLFLSAHILSKRGKNIKGKKILCQMSLTKPA